MAPEDYRYRPESGRYLGAFPGNEIPGRLMNLIALKMLIGDRARYIGIIIGLTFASLLITQQSAIFAGVMTRTFSFLSDVGLPDIWVVNPQVKYIDDIRPMQDTEVLRVRGVEGVEWAVPLYKGNLAVRRTD